jgi:hypothetical protein
LSHDKVNDFHAQKSADVSFSSENTTNSSIATKLCETFKIVTKGDEFGLETIPEANSVNFFQNFGVFEPLSDKKENSRI